MGLAGGGLVAGVVGGITNVPGTPLVLYFYALGLTKREFVGAVAFTFVLYKVVQLATVIWYGLMTLDVLGMVAGADGGRAGGLRGSVCRCRTGWGRVFNRAVLVFLAVLGGWLVLRTLTRPG